MLNLPNIRPLNYLPFSVAVAAAAAQHAAAIAAAARVRFDRRAAVESGILLC
jgi:hypothetical protein